MIHWTGLREVLTIYLCGPLLLSIQFGSKTKCLGNNQTLFLCNYRQTSSQIIATIYDVTLGVSLPLFWKQNCRMTKSCLNGISKHAWVSFWDFPMSILLLWKMFIIWVLDISHPCFIWSLMIYLRRSFALKIMRMFLTKIFNDLFGLNRYWYSK